MTTNTESVDTSDMRELNANQAVPVSQRFFAYDGLCVVAPARGSLGTAELHLAVWHGAHPDLCDACSLQASCTELFGVRGMNCAIHKKGKRWVKINENIQKTIAKLLGDKEQ